MLKNITLGQYYPVDSLIHRLDPRIKLILTIAEGTVNTFTDRTAGSLEGDEIAAAIWAEERGESGSGSPHSRAFSADSAQALSSGDAS